MSSSQEQPTLVFAKTMCETLRSLKGNVPDGYQRRRLEHLITEIEKLEAEKPLCLEKEQSDTLYIEVSQKTHKTGDFKDGDHETCSGELYERYAAMVRLTCNRCLSGGCDFRNPDFPLERVSERSNSADNEPVTA